MYLVDKNDFALRLASTSKSDAEIIYRLRFNESDLHFFSDTVAPPLERHSEWLTTELTSEKSLYFIAEDVSTRDTVGFVRFENAKGSANWDQAFNDFLGEVWLVSFAIRSDLRNRGLGTALIKLTSQNFTAIKDSTPITLVSWAIASNLASWKCFTKNGWEKKLIVGFREVVFYHPHNLA